SYPKCTVCKPFELEFSECYHENHWPEGAPCSTRICLRNVIKTATCSLNQAGQDGCDCELYTHYNFHRATQYTYIDGTCPGGSLQWQVKGKQYFGCATDMSNNHCQPLAHEGSCFTSQCNGTLYSVVPFGL